MQPPEFRFYYFTSLYEETVAFYRDLLGLEVHFAWDRSQLDRGTIFRSPNGRGLIEVEAGPSLPSVLGGLYIEVPNVEEWYARLRASGVPIRKELGETSYGHRNFKSVDPSGIEVSFFCRIREPPDAGDTSR
jgi:catechol 2,3-dioxygenase-like lactoylglutathione lyase family enzyme